MDTEPKHSVVSGIIEAFLKGNLAILLIIIALAAGAAALFLTPREEEPQIVVPLADVMVMYPGGSAQEVERLVSSRLERMLYQIDGVEYVYSMSRPGMAVVTVRFRVGEDREKSLIKLYNKIFQNIDKTTPGIAGWVVKPIEIDDVPIVNVALYSDRYDEHTLYRVGEEVVARLQHIPNTGNITLPRRTAPRAPRVSRHGAHRSLRLVPNGDRRRAQGVERPDGERRVRTSQRFAARRGRAVFFETQQRSAT